ncbi:MAG: hypothetical protein R2747_14020 [Pyrinomonadaceae bacterium]
MRKKYLIKLDGEVIGHTYFERHDAPMGVVLGDIKFEGIESGYAFFRDYCIKHNVPINQDEAEQKFIDTQHIEGIKIISEDGTEIKGEGICVRGFDEEGFEIDVFGIPYPFYGEEFKHHREDYDNQFKENA